MLRGASAPLTTPCTPRAPPPLHRICPPTTALALAAIVLRGELRGLAHAAALRISAATGQPVDERSLAESLVSAFNAWAKDALDG